MARDTHRSRVYRAENTCFHSSSPAARRVTLKEAREIAARIPSCNVVRFLSPKLCSRDDMIARRAFERLAAPYPVSVGSSLRYCAGGVYGVTLSQRDDWPLWIILHELAHVIDMRLPRGAGWSGHGQRWRCIYLGLLAEFVSLREAEALIEAFRRAGVPHLNVTQLERVAA